MVVMGFQPRRAEQDELSGLSSGVPIVRWKNHDSLFPKGQVAPSVRFFRDALLRSSSPFGTVY